ncbi:hypothetical protein TOT_020000065 [Theileria orientalis strain Shintoku]|uniref:Uncharacterized protein n=1 Tax=Theileria orientalis strain Shintoku TaxID=869250 RepID=J4DNZ0_THEOR|nr:hypothetical protein TOT_020000065 [Theileria orientalis strain Shintoku]PVC50240.1 hypothetical protein MACL_00002416 [Theileria orientalis]BAM39794.1 hypothetical protein TOT_020000065 [Theileria orientalis strain Shintoku]|eukprot:XP_009690095.1 hypothetical protein TOT_020000065 [Theileria orientalis strain Shintoku]
MIKGSLQTPMPRRYYRALVAPAFVATLSPELPVNT